MKYSETKACMKNMDNNDTTFYIELGGKVGKYFNRNWFIDINSPNFLNFIEKKKRECNNTDMYECIYYRSNTDDISKAYIVAPLYIDIDGNSLNDNDYNIAKKETISVIQILKNNFFLKNEDIEIFFSGSKGFHIIIPAEVLGIQPCKNLNVIYKSFVQKIESMIKDSSCIDTGIYDNRRLFRLPNTINSKTGAYKIQITEKELRTLSVSEMLSLAGGPREVIRRNYCLNEKARNAFLSTAKFKQNDNISRNKSIEVRVLPEEERKLFPCTIAIMKHSWEIGCRNNISSIIATSLFYAGWSYEEIVEIMFAWNQNNLPPMDEHEVMATIKSAMKMCSEGKKYGCSTYSSIVPNNICDHCAIYNRQAHR